MNHQLSVGYTFTHPGSHQITRTHTHTHTHTHTPPSPSSCEPVPVPFSSPPPTGAASSAAGAPPAYVWPQLPSHAAQKQREQTTVIKLPCSTLSQRSGDMCIHHEYSISIIKLSINLYKKKKLNCICKLTIEF